MIGRDNISGIEKILEIKPNFMWHYLNFIEGIKYYIDLDAEGKKVSFVEMLFSMKEPDNQSGIQISLKFNSVNCFKIQTIGGSYNQILGLEIVDQREKGWEPDNRYLVSDYEDGKIEFYCCSIEVMSVESLIQ